MTSVFEEKSIPKAIFRVGLPAMLGQLTTLIYNLADTFFVSMTENPDMIAAVTLCTPKRKLWIGHYQRAYRGVLAPSTTLDDLFDRHNMDSRPFGQRMRSMSVSDVVVLNRGGEEKAFYVDRLGFEEVPQFLKPPVRKRRRSGPER